jgi:hypothetical protein
MERGARREVGVEGRLSVVRQRGQEDDKGVTKQRTMVFESLGVGMLLWPGGPGGQAPRNQKSKRRGSAQGPERPARGAQRPEQTRRMTSLASYGVTR